MSDERNYVDYDVVSVTRLKVDNPLYGSTLIEYVSSLSLYL